MKYSFMSFSTPAMGLEETLALAASLGYDGIEPRLDAKHAHGVEVAAGPADRDRIRAAFARSGVAAACLATSCRLADPAVSGQMIDQAHQRIDLAGDIGCGAIRVFGGQFGEDCPRGRAVDQMAASLSALADHAAERGVKVCFETHDAWCDPHHVAEVLARVDRPTAAANWDIMHPVRGGYATIEESFELLRPWIAHLHVHDGTDVDGSYQLVPIGHGDVDHRRVVELLRSIDFGGFLSGEWINWEPHPIHLPRELATLRQMEARVG